MQRPFFAKGKSSADVNYETPAWLFDLLDREFEFTHDLAAVKQNAKKRFFHDSLSVDWHKLDGWLWLNPPFSGVRRWIEKAAAEANLGAKLVVLVPPSVLGGPYMQACHPKTIRFVARATRFKNTFSGKVISFLPTLLIYNSRARGRTFLYQALSAAS